MNGPEGFTYPMLDAWARLTGRDVDPQEIEALLRLDLLKRATLQPRSADA